MNTSSTKPAQDQQRTVKGSFAMAFAWTTTAWVAVTTVLIVVVKQVQPGVLNDSLLIAVGSLMVAGVSMLPGLVLSSHKGGILVSMMAGILIRLVGTVALFLTCRYQLASSMEMIASMTIAWYVFLTMIEVCVLGRTLPKQIPESRSDSVDTPVPAGA